MEIIDPIYICVYCGDVMEQPSERMMATFGEKALNCCDMPMVRAERNKIYQMAKATEKLKENLEQHILKGLL